MSWAQVGSTAFEVFEDVRGAVAMYMFIIEESIQTVGMANWILYKNNQISKMQENAEWIRDNLAQPLKNFATSGYGTVAYPMNLAYAKFADATLKTVEAILNL